LANEGHTIIVTYNNNKEKAQSVVNQIVENNGNALLSKLNVVNRNSIKNSIKKTISNYGRLDILVNNAGILVQNNFLDILEKEWDEVFSVNVKGVFNCCQIAIPELIKNENSKIINIASFAGKYGGPKAPHYSASKAAVICLTKSLARIYSKHRLLVNAVAPGVIETEMFLHSSKSSATMGIEVEASTPKAVKTIESDILLGRIGSVEEVANVVAFLASDKSNYITGSTIDVNGGLLLS
jgi:NAD(P)-dependent dehydrogenase (short-subunit alcohol dehydrogenase family)